MLYVWLSRGNLCHNYRDRLAIESANTNHRKGDFELVGHKKLQISAACKQILQIFKAIKLASLIASSPQPVLKTLEEVNGCICEELTR